MTMTNWQPSASIDTLKARARLLQQVRAFFIEREVTEVETPLIATAIGTDVQLDPVPVGLAGESQAWLQTSPEFPMKRLLAAGSGPVFQISRAFRNGDSGRLHNPEFSMLEWYRPGWSMQQLMNEVVELVDSVLPIGPPEVMTYREAFQQILAVDPFVISDSALQELAHEYSCMDTTGEDRDCCLDLLYTHVVESQLPKACFLTEYPASQAALARIDRDANGNLVGRRFELIVDGVELANGYDELTDSAEQRARFFQDLQKRASASLPEPAVDERFLAALESGLPDCCGVALGLDRLFMLALGKKSVAEVMAFDISRV